MPSPPRDLASLLLEVPLNASRDPSEPRSITRRSTTSAAVSPGRERALSTGRGGFARRVASDISGGPDSIEYDAQAGCPRDVAGGTYRSNVVGAPVTGPSVDPRPFKLSK